MTRDLRPMRPKLKSSVYFAPADDGIFFFNGGEGFVLAGDSIYAWVERLAPFLNGRHTVGELVADLPAGRRVAVERVVGMLDDRGLVRDLSQDRPHGLDERELETYAPEITFIEEFHDSAAHRFERYRNARVLAVGSGDPLVALAAGALRSGTRSLTVARTGEDDGELDRIHAYAEERAEHDPVQRVECHVLADDDLEAGEGLFARLVSTADLVMHVADGSAVERARIVDRLCTATRTVSCQAVTVDDEGWIGPFCHPAQGGARWEPVWRRMRPRPQTADPEAATGPVAGILANHLVFTCFHRLTGDGGAQDGGAQDGGAQDGGAQVELLRLDLDTLETGRHRATPHPLALAAAPADPERVAAAVAELERGEPLNDETFVRRVSPLVDSRLGVLRAVDERHYDQFPLRVAEASLWDPAGGEPLVVYGAAVDLTDARRRAVLRAIELYASLTADPRRLLGDGTAGHGLVAGVSLKDGRPRTVPAATVFPRRRRSAPSGLTGVAARLSWPEAVEAALLDQWTDLVVRSPDLRGQDPPRIDPAALPLDEVGARFRDVLDLLGREYAVRDMTADKRVPTFAFTLSGRTVAYRSGVAAASAVRDGLLQLLLAYQASATGQPEYAPEPVRQLPSAPPEYTAPSFDPPSLEPSAEQRRSLLVEAFEAAGRTPVLVPLDHDPAVVQALPYVLRVVVLADG